MTNNNKIFISHYDTVSFPSDYSLVKSTDIQSIKPNSVEHIFIKDIIGLYADDNLILFIKSLIEKIKPGGFLFIQDIDVEQFSIYLANKAIPLEDKKLLYFNRTNIFYIQFILKILRPLKDISINQINFVNGYEFYISIQKNE